MGRKNSGPTHSQRLGILWLSAGLLLFAAVVFFSQRHPAGTPAEDPEDTALHTILATHEDSAMRQRYENKRKNHYTSKKEQYTQHIDSTFYTRTPPPPTRQPLRVELNSADTLTLQLLHGIGPAYARRIVRYRDRLGGFTSVEQLNEVYGFTPQLLDHIRPSLVLDTGNLHKISINNVELKQLAKHPYVEYYQARDIVRLRSLGQRFRTADDLRAIPSMSDSTLQRLLPYIEFGDGTQVTPSSLPSETNQRVVSEESARK